MRHFSYSQYLRTVELRRDKVDSFSSYPFSLEAVRNLFSLELHPKVTFIVGENGTGKSTILEAIATAYGFNAEGGTKNFNFSTMNTHSDLCEYIKLVKGARKPEAALSPSRQMTLLARMHKLVQQDSQFIITTHSPIIMSYPDSIIYELDEGFNRVEYKETNHYQVMKQFINNTDRMLSILMDS